VLIAYLTPDKLLAYTPSNLITTNLEYPILFEATNLLVVKVIEWESPVSSPITHFDTKMFPAFISSHMLLSSSVLSVNAYLQFGLPVDGYKVLTHHVNTTTCPLLNHLHRSSLIIAEPKPFTFVDCWNSTLSTVGFTVSPTAVTHHVGTATLNAAADL